MEVSVTGLSSSTTPTKPFVTQKPSVSDENEHYYQQMGSPNLSNPKKSMNKHYMSPTISAASKAVSSRRNILGERNDAFESTLSTAHVGKSNPLTPESHIDDDHNDVSEELSSRPYDPVTNFLSPRPQFLRYKPSRRREILIGLENSTAEGNDGLSLSRSGSFESQKAIDEEVGSVTTSSSSLASSCKQEDEDVEGISGKAEGSDGEIKEIVEAIQGIDIVSEGIDEETEGSDEEVEESDDEDEEFEEEKKGWSFKGVLKNLFLLAVLVLLTSHISSMNQETHFEGVEEGDLRSQNHTVETDLLKKHESGESCIWDNRGKGHMSIVEGIKGAIEIGIEEGEVVEAVEHHSDFYDSDEEVMEEMKIKREDSGALEHAADDLREVFQIQTEEIEVVELVEGEEEKGVAEDTEGSDQMVENSEFHVVATPGNDESFKLNQTPLMSDDASNASNGEGEFAVESIEEMDTTAELVMSDTEDNASNASNGEGGVAVESIEEMDMTAEVMSDTMDNDYTGLDDEVLDFGAEESWRDKVLNYMIHIKPKSFYTTPVVGVSILSVAAASLALVFFFRRMKGNKDSVVIANTSSMKTLIIEQKKNIGKKSSLPLKTYSESVISERYNSAIANKEEDDSIYSSFRRMSLSSNSKHSTEAGSEEYHRKVPTVELLGEFAVGEVSSPLQSYGMKKSLIREGEQSNYAISSEKKFRSQIHSISVPQQPSATEFSSMDSFSNGSYTSEKLMKKKETEAEFSSMDTSHGSYTSEQIVRKLEGGKNGEVKLIATPVRRSSRIRSKTVMSP